MAVTRIKNNQITDATIVASSKLQDYSISAAKIANNLTYGSNLTVAGNLTVQGNTTTIDTNIVTIEDPVILLASTQTGAPAVDIGFIGQRGSANNIAFVWDESAQTFVTAFTDTVETSTTLNVTGYANLTTLNANVTAGLTVAGQSNIANLTVAANSIVSFGNVVISNVAEPIANTDAATKFYVDEQLGNSGFNITDGATTETVNGGDTVDFDGTTDQITVNVASVSANTSSVTVALATNVSVVGNVTVGANLGVTGTVVSNLIPGSNATYNLGNATNTWKDLYLAGNSIYIDVQTIGANGDGVQVSNTLSAGNFATTGNVSATGTVTAGNIDTGGAVSAVGNVTSGNVNTGGAVSAVGTVTGGNVVTGGTISATGTATLGNINSGGTVSSTGNITGGNVLTGGDVSATGNLTAVNASLTTASASGNITGGNLATGGTISSGGMATLGNVESGGTMSATGNITGGNVLTGGILSSTGNVQGGNLVTLGLISATGNLTAGNIATAGTFEAASLSATGNVTGGNIITSGLANLHTVETTGITSTGTANVGNLTTGGTVSAVGTATLGNVNTGGVVSATGNVTGGNVLTGGLISATGNVNGSYIIANSGFESPAVTITSTTANAGISLVTNGTGNINVNTSFINGVKDPEQAQDAATKSYVDAVVQGLDPKASVHAATYGALPAYTYNNGTAGVGATITGTATGVLTVDGDTIAIGQRVLVKNETAGNAAYNGIYLCTTAGAIGVAYVLTRAVDFDVADEMYGAFTFVETGTINADTGWICTNNSATGIVVGTTAIVFTQFSGAGQYTAGNALSIDGTQFNVNTDGSANATIGINGSNQLIIPASAVLTTPNIGAATGTSLSASGNVTGGNVLTGGLISSTGNITGGNLITSGAFEAASISAVGNIIGGNISTLGIANLATIISTGLSVTGTATVGNVSTAGFVSAVGNIDSGNIRTTGTVSATGSVDAGNVLTGGLMSATGNVTAGNLISNGNFDTVSISATGNIKGGNLQTGGTISSTGTATVGNLETGGTVSSTGTATLGNVATGGTISATGNITGGNIFTSGAGGEISGSGNITAGGTVSSTGTGTFGNVATGGTVSAVGNITANVGSFFIGNGSQLTGVSAASAIALINGNTNVTTATNGNANITIGGASNVVVFTTTGVNVTGTVSANGTVTGGNVDTGGAVSATGNITGGNVATGGLISATGTITSANTISGVDISASGNVTGVTFIGNVEATTVSATGNVTGGNVLTGGLISAAGNITGNVVSGTSATFGNIVLIADTINGLGGIVNINSALADVNFAVNGDNTANILFVDAGTETISIGSNAQTTGAILAINATNSILFPVGNTVQRPATGVVGMLRYNTSFDTLEQYTNNNGWEEVGTPAFTVIADNQFNGDGSTVAFTLTQESTTAGSVVAINGVQQLPTTAYAISGTTLTFTEAPAVSDVIDVRMFTTTTTVTGISNAAANAVIDTSEVSANILVTGNLVVSGPGVFVGDGSGLTNLNVSGNTISSGTSKVDVVSVNGNVATVVAGNTIITVSPGLVDIQGNLSVSGNATLSGNILGDRIQNGSTSLDIQTASGNANISVGGTSNVAVFTTAGVNVTGTVSANGTVTGGNIATGGTVSATGNITGANFIGNVVTPAGGAVSTTGNITGGNILTGGIVSSTGNVTASNLLTGGIVSSTGNVTASNLLTGGIISATGNATVSNIDAVNHIGTTVSVIGTVTGGNITTGGTISSTGNATVGNLSATNVTGTLTTASQTNITSVGTLTALAVTGNISSGNISATNHTGTTVSVTGQVTGSQFNGSGAGLTSIPGGNVTGTVPSATTAGTVTTAAQGNITSVGTLTALTVSGAITVNSGNGVTAIINGGTNGVGNIGSSGQGFNTIFAKATSAQYADLAEKYEADAEYAPGTVVAFGGDKEVTLADEAGSTRVAGVVSTNPSYIMNAGLEAEHVAMVALQGRVPCRVIGPVAKGDMMVAAGNGAAQVDNSARAGTIIGKALENFDGAEGTIEVVIGRN